MKDMLGVEEHVVKGGGMEADPEFDKFFEADFADFKKKKKYTSDEVSKKMDVKKGKRMQKHGGSTRTLMGQLQNSHSTKFLNQPQDGSTPVGSLEKNQKASIEDHIRVRALGRGFNKPIEPVYKSKTKQRLYEAKEISRQQTHAASHANEILSVVTGRPEDHQDGHADGKVHHDTKQPATTPLLTVPDIVRGQILNKPWKSPFDNTPSMVQKASLEALEEKKMEEISMSRRHSQYRGALKDALINSHGRLSMVWEELQVPIVQKLEFMEKYSTLEYATELASVIPLWEKCASLVVAREAIIDKIKALQQGHLYVAGFHPQVEATISMSGCEVDRIEDESDAMWLHKKLGLVGEVCLKAMYRLKEVADDRVTFRGNDYIRLCEIGGTNQPAYFGNSYERQRSS